MINAEAVPPLTGTRDHNKVLAMTGIVDLTSCQNAQIHQIQFYKPCPPKKVFIELAIQINQS